MVWVEARAFGVPLAAMTILAAGCVALARSHVRLGIAPFFGITMLFVVVLVAGRLWSQRLDRGRKARYAPLVFNTIGIGGGVLLVIMQLWNEAALQHSAQGAIALLAGAVAALLFLGLVLRHLASSLGRSRAMR